MNLGKKNQIILNKTKSFCNSRCGNPSRENPSLTQARHRHHLTKCSKCIKECLDLATNDNTPIAAHHLRKGLHHLGKITGHVSTEEILDVIFKDFCIGK